MLYFNHTQKGGTMEPKKQIVLLMTSEQKEILQTFSKKIAHASTLGGWLKALAFRELENATPEQKQKFNELMGV